MYLPAIAALLALSLLAPPAKAQTAPAACTLNPVNGELRELTSSGRKRSYRLFVPAAAGPGGAAAAGLRPAWHRRQRQRPRPGDRLRGAGRARGFCRRHAAGRRFALERAGGHLARG
jgi:poly(3-hydroxybutyrate) depolymerase